MAVTMDELIDLKNQAVEACGAVVASWESGNLSDAASQCAAVDERARNYEQADADDSVVSLEEWESKHNAD